MNEKENGSLCLPFFERSASRGGREGGDARLEGGFCRVGSAVEVWGQNGAKSPITAAGEWLTGAKATNISFLREPSHPSAGINGVN